MKIRQILSTKSESTIEVDIETGKGLARSSVPVGTSRGKYEVKYLSISQVVKNFLEIKKHFIQKQFKSQEEVDQLLKKLDGTKNFSKLGGNLSLAISSAFLKTFALNEGLEVFEYLGGKKLPKILANVAGGWGKESEIQEFLLFPKMQRSFAVNAFKIAEIYLKLGRILKKKDKTFKFGKNYESAWVTSLSTEKLLQTISSVIKNKGISMGLDVAASDRWDGKKYMNRKPKEHFNFIVKLIKKFKLGFIEDPFHEDDFENSSSLTGRFGKKLMVCGDDLLATNVERLKLALKKNAINAVLIKPNQVGTISDTIAFVKLARKHELKTVISHRSGTTDDPIISHLGVGLECDYAKIGISGERIIKINELIRIEEKLKNR